ncbi:MAG: hypothetical protein A2151_07370 [Candidatus Muproteobacteria bacterium RBG_16_65_34]|uniref:Peptidase S24/S26A/S26B/S26C domain-containing protein n=1 Tax=Candidatus Muproteobacteria bacterium RBG_16_65_34 TaxID=1817760 RepID=A0A1F6TVK1_9PROT|nr:MAG: hypothetical protein A2151_07370 [Candidatus Muproteobacteria bacterium RBG_16_65_34]
MPEPRKHIPIVSVPAGEPQQGDIHSCAEAEPYALRVLGDSMAPEFQDGHIVIVDPAQPASHEAYVIVDYAGETIFRQFIVEGARKLIKPLNDAYPTVEIVGEYRVRGVVVQRAGRRRKDRKHYY